MTKHNFVFLLIWVQPSNRSVPTLLRAAKTISAINDFILFQVADNK